MRLLAVAALMLTVLAAGCATGRTDAAESNQIHAFSGGQFAIERVEKIDNRIEVGGWPAGMEEWTPDQIAALAGAKAKGAAAVLAELLTSKQVPRGPGRRGDRVRHERPEPEPQPRRGERRPGGPGAPSAEPAARGRWDAAGAVAWREAPYPAAWSSSSRSPHAPRSSVTCATTPGPARSRSVPVRSSGTTRRW